MRYANFRCATVVGAVWIGCSKDERGEAPCVPREEDDRISTVNQRTTSSALTKGNNMPNRKLLISVVWLCAFLGITACENFDETSTLDGDENRPVRLVDVCVEAQDGVDCEVYEAEARSAQNGCKEVSIHAGFSGSGFMDFGGNGSWIEWNGVSASKTGEYTLIFGYANGGSANRQTAVIVNGKNVATIPFSSTQSWKTWSTQTATVVLNQGVNTIRILADTGSGGPNLDNMVVLEVEDGPIYEAEHFSQNNGCRESREHAGYTGSGFMDFGGMGTWIEWNQIHAKKEGEHEVAFRYANGNSVNRSAHVFVNGKQAADLSFSSTGSWKNWSSEKVTLTFKQGTNTVRVFASTGSGGPNMDHMEIVEEPKSLSEMFATCQTEIASALPLLRDRDTAAFMEAHRAEGQNVGEAPNTGYHDLDAVAKTLRLARPILESDDVENFLSDDSMGKSLVQCALLANALPAGLEEYSKASPQQKALVDSLVKNFDLMRQMLIAGGAKAGRYGRAMEIYKSILDASDHARSGVLQKLAVATSLELAAPELCTNYDKIDPLKRFLYYEQLYLDGQLTPYFSSFTTWELRHVINDWYSEQDADWLRTMVRNFRPDLIVRNTKGELFGVQSPSIPQIPFDFDESLPYTYFQQVLDRGGQCGAKAFLGRALIRSFGIPVWGVTQKGHADIGYWAPHGWQADWDISFWRNDMVDISGRIHLLETQARTIDDEFEKALRLEWIGDILGEEDIDLMIAGHGDLWSALSLNKKRQIVEDEYIRPSATPIKATREITERDKQIAVDNHGTITISAVACTNVRYPSEGCNKRDRWNPSKKIAFIENEQGEMLLHYMRLDDPEEFDYTVSVPKAGRYKLTADVVTVNSAQNFIIVINGTSKPVQFDLPYTVGRWGTSQPIVIQLVEGTNTLRFSRNNPYPEGSYSWYCNTHNDPDCGGITVKSFKLTPVD